MFHSIYDTEYVSTSSKYTRTEVQRLIGYKSENLVYKFCRLTGRVNNIIYRREEWTDQEYLDLLHIELANMLEQKYYNYEVKMLEAILKFEVAK